MASPLSIVGPLSPHPVYTHMHWSAVVSRPAWKRERPNAGLTSGKKKWVLRSSEEEDRWRGLALDTSDDQQDITRGKGMVDSLFQAPMGCGTHHAVMSSYDYISNGIRRYVKPVA